MKSLRFAEHTIDLSLDKIVSNSPLEVTGGTGQTEWH